MTKIYRATWERGYGGHVYVSADPVDYPSLDAILAAARWGTEHRHPQVVYARPTWDQVRSRVRTWYMVWSRDPGAVGCLGDNPRVLAIVEVIDAPAGEPATNR